MDDFNLKKFLIFAGVIASALFAGFLFYSQQNAVFGIIVMLVVVSALLFWQVFKK